MTTKAQNFTSKHSVILKVATITVLILLLLIPTSMIRFLISERKERQTEAVKEVGAKWGEAQTLLGPVLTVPYKSFDLDKNGQKINIVTHNAFFLPEELNITGSINPETRYRGIFEIAVYNAKLNFAGKFNNPDFSGFKNIEIMAEKAFVTFGITDMRGIKELIQFKWNNENYVCESGTEIDNVINSGVTIKIPEIEKDDSDIYIFSFDISLNGSKNISFIPVGKETNVKLSSSWNDPSFDGAFLPDERTINESGFTSSWKILQFNRNFSQNWIDKYVDFSSSAFGVSLILPVDMYQKSDRSVKYAILFITLTFVVFFFIEILKKIKVHPIQYILIGVGLCLFYLMLLSLSEQIKFEYAYLIASAGIIGLLTFYSKSVFKNYGLPLLLSGVLIILYAFIYVLLQSEDYALLMGSLGLFLVLAIIMFLSRKINWYSINTTNNKENQENN